MYKFNYTGIFLFENHFIEFATSNFKFIKGVTQNIFRLKKNEKRVKKSVELIWFGNKMKNHVKKIELR